MKCNMTQKMHDATQTAVLKLFLFVAVTSIATALISDSFELAVAQDQEPTRTIAGKILNGTAGGEPPAELTVFVLVIDEGAEAIVERVESVTKADGSFALEVPAITDAQFYRVVADDGIYTPYVDVLGEDAGEDVTLTVYDRTASLDEIAVTSYSMVIPVVDEANGVIGVLAAVNLVNSGDEVYLADLTNPDLTGFNLLRFNLPVGYQELTVESDLPSGNVMEINTGFAISNPVPPGEYSMVISYSVPFEGDEFSYPMRLPFGAETVSILLPVDAGEVTGMGLTRSQEVTIGDGQYVQYDGSNYERRAELGVVITGLPAPDLGTQVMDFFNSVQFRIAIVVSVALALTAVVAYVVLIARRARPAVVSTGDVYANEGDPDRSAIIGAIAELDEMRELDKIPEDEYLVRRQRLVQKAIRADEG